MHYRSRILGTGSFLPEKTLTNYDLEKIVETSHDWIVERTGIVARHMAAPGQHTSDLALIAAQEALAMAGLKAQDLELILFATVSPDQIMPNAACTLQAKLGAREIMAVDLSAACSGFVYGLAIADQFIRCGTYKNILVVGAEVLHTMVDYSDRETCILFGDGAGAAVVGATTATESNSQILSFHLHADGKLGDVLTYPAAATLVHDPEEFRFVKMKGRELFKIAVRTMGQSCHEALKHNQLSVEDLDWLIPHQANSRIMEAVAKQLDLPVSKVINEISHMGNTSAATVPYALDRGVRSGRIERDDLVLLTAFGGGVTSGSLLMRF